MNRFFATTILIALLAQLPAALAAGKPAPGPVSDVRVLIDVSGSMKDNDPHNLRAPALRLIVGLLPDGAQAGVWTFGEYVNMLVPHGQVNRQWRAKARAASRQINSAGLFTNIEDALKRATWDWHSPDPHVQRSLILLTDGLVDVSKDKAKDAASRRRILDDILPRLHKAGVTVHTIALGGDADADLLTQLAAGTGGRFRQVADAAGLEKTFLHMFERATHRDTLPLTHNEIQVDKHIEELTLLIFRKHDAQPTRIVEPGRRTVTQGSAPDNVRWHHETGYDLITIERPRPGRWKVLAGEDPDNRVMVVTDLKLQVSPLPEQILVDRRLPLTLRLTQKGRTITNRHFLSFVDATLIQNNPDGQSLRWPIKDDGVAPDKKAHDGIYTVQLGDSLTPGRHEFRILVDGITFQRETRRLLSVFRGPVITSLTPTPADDGTRYTLSVIPRAGLIDPATLKVRALVTGPQGHEDTVDVPRAQGNEWRAAVGNAAAGVYHLTLKVRGRSPDGRPIEYEQRDLAFGTAAAPPQPAPAKAPPPPAPRKTAAPSPPPKAPATVPATVPATDVKWMVVASSIIAINLIVMIGGYFAVRRLRVKTRLSITELEEELA